MSSGVDPNIDESKVENSSKALGIVNQISVLPGDFDNVTINCTSGDKYHLIVSVSIYDLSWEESFDYMFW